MPGIEPGTQEGKAFAFPSSLRLMGEPRDSVRNSDLNPQLIQIEYCNQQSVLFSSSCAS